MHSMLGINEADFLAAGAATYRLASEHRGWQGEGSRFMHAHGELGSELSGTPFYKYLLNEALEGRAVSGEDFSVATLAARQGRFARPMGEGDALTASFTYGFHLEEAAYTAFLRQHAAKLGVRNADGTLAEVELDGGGDISALRLENGQRLSADLYVDCSGPQAAVIGRLAPGDREDWSSSLPCDRMLSGVMPAHPSAPALTQTTATASGWLWRAPTAAHTHAGYVYCSRFLDDDGARRALSTALNAITDLRIETLHAGRRRSPWVRNCVAIGSAAIELEPLVGADLHGAQLGIGTLIELFPAGAVSAVEAAEYNRVMAGHGDGLRDFTLAHYRLGAARAGAFWDAVRAAPLPPRLAHKIDLFSANGRIDVYDFESFEETDWAWLFLGARQVPSALELQIHARVAQIRPEQVAPLREYVQRLVQSMPPHMEFVRRFGARSAQA
jgi:tryptophan halogenase